MDPTQIEDSISNSIEKEEIELADENSISEINEESQHEIEKIGKMRLEKQNFLGELQNTSEIIEEESSNVIYKFINTYLKNLD